MPYIRLLLPLLMLFAGCAKIPVRESDVFLPKKSVTPQTFAVAGVSLEEVFFPAADTTLQLNAWYLSRPDAVATVLFFGGQGFYLVQSYGYVEALTALPLNVFMVDYRGYGKSEGVPGVSALKADALVAYDLVRARYAPREHPILVHGHSLGSFLALHTSTERPAAGVVLENPATDVKDWTRSLLPWIMRLFVRFEVDASFSDESNLDRIRRLRAPLLLFGGTEDVITPPKLAETLYDEAQGDKTLVLIEGGGHNQLYRDAAYFAAYQAFVDRVVASENP